MAISYKDWYIPFKQDMVSLRQAKESMASVRANQDEIPLMVQLVENPKFQIPGIRLFHGAVDLNQHDYIHAILGRGLLDKDEAFTIGFTMGSTSKVTTTEETLYALVSRYLYPEVYKFDEEAIEVFKNAVRLGYISSCAPLDEFDFAPYLDLPMREVRARLGLEKPLILAYYEIEKARYPDARDSQRLLDETSEFAVSIRRVS
ncbi:MAG: hypothetical protein L0Z73_14370 [Gammaproteobacteria bacterium]|nr:hypothetical protein [Gammaproteobacteria bacterium]